MLESRWRRRVGPVLATTGAVLVVASTAFGAPSIEDGPPPTCPAPPPAIGLVRTWYALEPVLERGTLTGQRLRVGTLAGPTWTIALPAEAWATGPVDGQVLFGSDDGQTSVVRRFDGALGCTWDIATTTDVVRSAVQDPLGGAIHEHRLARGDRRDLGIWERHPGSDRTARVLGALSDDGRFGRTWRTDLAWSDDRDALVAATCGELACRYRVLHRDGLLRTVVHPDLGALVGLVDGRLVVRGACRGLPCPLVAVDPASGERTVLLADAGPAGLLPGDDSGQVAVVDGAGDVRGRLRAVDVGTGRATPIAGDRPPVPTGAALGAELPDGWFLVDGPEDPDTALHAASIRHAARPLHEVQP